jgi:hypothetical protein
MTERGNFGFNPERRIKIAQERFEIAVVDEAEAGQWIAEMHAFIDPEFHELARVAISGMYGIGKDVGLISNKQRLNPLFTDDWFGKNVFQYKGPPPAKDIQSAMYLSSLLLATTRAVTELKKTGNERSISEEDGIFIEQTVEFMPQRPTKLILETDPTQIRLRAQLIPEIPNPALSTDEMDAMLVLRTQKGVHTVIHDGAIGRNQPPRVWYTTNKIDGIITAATIAQAVQLTQPKR